MLALHMTVITLLLLQWCLDDSDATVFESLSGWRHHSKRVTTRAQQLLDTIIRHLQRTWQELTNHCLHTHTHTHNDIRNASLLLTSVPNWKQIFWLFYIRDEHTHLHASV